MAKFIKPLQIKCLTDKKEQLKVRLYQIDAPEAGQAYAQKAKQVLSDMIYGEDVDIEIHGEDKYKRVLGTITTLAKNDDGSYADDIYIDINLAMVFRGYAWCYPFTKKKPDCLENQNESKLRKYGLWADKNPIAPWTWRKQKNKTK